MLNTPSPSPTFGNIFNAGTTVISPVIDRILREVASREQALPPLEVNFDEKED
jgi:hypothetical protein